MTNPQKKVAFFRSMRGKIVVVCVLMVMAVSTILGALTYFQSQSTLHELAANNLKQSSMLITAHVTDTLQNNMAIVRSIANSEIAQSMDPDRITPYLKVIHQEYEMFTAFYAVGLDGKTIASSSGSTMNVADRTYFKQAKQGQANISDPVVARDTGLIVIVFSAPIQKNGKVIGVIIAANTTQNWEKLMASAQSGVTDETYLINQGGFFLTPSRFADSLKTAGVIKTRSELELKDESTNAKAALAGQSGIGEFINYRGRYVMGTYQPIQVENIHWGLISMIEQDEINAPITYLGFLIIISTIIIILVFLALALFIAGQLTRPLSLVAEAAHHIALGDINQEVKVINYDEVGLVAEAFQTMIVYLNELANAAERLANGDLKIKVIPKSDKDVFSHAFIKMVANLQKYIRTIEDERTLLQTFLDNIPDAIYFKDTESCFIQINQAQANHFGLSDPAQAIGKKDRDYFSEQHARPAFEDEQNIIRSGQPIINKEEKETWPDGHAGWVSTTKMPIRNGSGKIIGTFGISRDITERKRAEISLQQRLMELETVNQLLMRLRAGDTVQELLQILLDETLRTIRAEDGAIFLFEPVSSKLELAISRGWFDHLAGLTLETNEGINGHVFSTNQPYITSEMQSDQFLAQKVKSLIPPQQSGGFFPVQCSEGIIGVLDVYVPLPRTISDDEQRMLAIISQLVGNAILRSRLNDKLKLSNIDLQKEIDQRAVVQNMLAAEKELLSTTLMSIAEGVIITDKEGFIVLYNQAAESITGYEASQVIDHPLDSIFQIIDPNTQHVVSDLIDTLYVLNRDQETNPNYKSPLLITKSGERILVAGSISPLKTPNGEMMGHVLVFQNITEKQKTEAQTALSEKMEAIGQLAAGIAHEINTPIQYIGDNLRFLEKTVSKFSEVLDAFQVVITESEGLLSQEDMDRIEAVKTKNKIQHYLKESQVAVQEALDGVERVRKIVLAMREFSHPSEKEKKLADINHGIETTVVISRNEWKYYAELETDLDPDLPLVNCYIDEINQVILNMIVNAAQAIQERLPAGSEEKGKISISTRQRENNVLLIIQDTGKGIPEAIQMRIFDPFFTTKGIGKGTGQGLSMAHNIVVKKHQGRIKVDSIVGVGTTFTIEIPIDSSGQES